MGVNGQNRRGVQSVHRALDLLELLSQRESAGVTELASASGLAVSTTHNLLRTLTDRNYLVCERGVYRVGSEGLALGSRTDPGRLLAPIIGPALETLSRTSRHSATATTLMGSSARLLAYSPGTGMITVNQTQLTWRNPLAMATGRVLVAHGEERDWDQFIPPDAPDELPHWSPERWHTEFQRIRSTGYSVRYLPATASPDAMEITAVAVPVRSTNDTVVCSVGIAIPTRLNADGVNDILEHLWTVVEPLSLQLGCTTQHQQPHATSEHLADLEED